MKPFRSIMSNRAFILCAIFCLLALSMSSCKDVHHQAGISFYHWKQDFSLDSNELAILSDNKVNELYVRFFDVTLEGGKCIPVSVIELDTSSIPFDIIPCIYIENKVFKKSVPNDLCQNVYDLVKEISEVHSLSIQEIQFDCDWTETSGPNYFQFLQGFQDISSWTISSTIRLHQFKYPQKTGVPPVDKGVLMCYNMNDIYDVNTENSIISNQTLKTYMDGSTSYSIPLDLAFPTYHWGLVYRLDDLALIVNDIEADSIPNYPFTKLSGTKYRADSSFYFNQTYFNRGDILRIEHSETKVLLECAETIANSEQRFDKVIFYHLNSQSIPSYDPSFFQKIANSIG